MDDKKIIKENIGKDESYTLDTDTGEEVTNAEESEEKILKTQLSRTMLSSEEDGFTNIKQYPESPFTYFESNQVNVQLNTGNVQYETTDFVLPGRDGFDLIIARRYDSGCANLVDMAPYVINSMLLTGSIDNSFYTRTYGLGHGWSFVLPSIETVQNLRWAWRPYLVGTRSYDYILHLEDGRNLQISRISDRFEDYSLKDVGIVTRSGTIQHPYAGNITKRYNIIIEYKNGNKDYFQSSYEDDNDRDMPYPIDFTLVARQDKFGNTIFYDLRKNGGMSIVDTWGRVINLEKTDYGLVWKLPESTDGKVCEISYNIDRRSTHKLNAVTNSVGCVTQYNYYNPEDYNGSMKCASPGVAGNNTKTQARKYLLLKNVTYPNNSFTQFTYDRSISIENNAGGYITHFALTMKRDIFDGVEYNRGEYKYTLEPESVSNGEYIKFAEVTNHQDILENYQFNKEGKLLIKEVRHQKTLISKGVYQYSNELMVSAVEQKYDRNNESNYLEKKSSWRYSSDQKADVIQYIEEYPADPSCNQEIYTSYGAYSIVLETERKRGSEKIKETNELHAELGNRVIKYHRVYENGVLKEKAGYDYKDGANPYCVTNERRYFMADGGDLEMSGEYAEIICKYNSLSSTVSRYTHNIISKEQIGILDADGNPCDPIREEFQYDNWGRLIFKKDSRNQITAYSYDELGRVIAATLPSANGQQAVNETYYNDRLTFITTTDANHQKKRIQYTPFGQIKQVCLAIANEPTVGDVVLQDFKYNTWGELTEAISYNGNGTTINDIRKTENYTYDSFGRMIYRCIPQVGYEEKYAYNEVFTDPADGMKYFRELKKVIGDDFTPDIVTECYKDQKDQVRKEFLAGEGLFIYQYDNSGNNISKIDARNTERFEYDYANRVVKSIRIDSGQERITFIQYDALGNKRFQWDEAGKKTEFQYDKAGRLVQTLTPFDHRSQKIKYYYDGAGNIIWKKKEQRDGWQETQYVYDARNRLTDTYQHLSSGNWIKTICRYDAMNQIILKRTGDTPSGEGREVTKYTYDRFGNITSTMDSRGYTEYYEYDKAGRLQKKTDRNKDQTVYQYDALERLMKETVLKRTPDGMVISEREYSYGKNDKNGKKIREVSRESVNGKQTVLLETSYRYNNKDQLIRQEDPGNVVKDYTYDIYGNRQSFKLTREGKIIPDISLYYLYDDLYRLKQVRKNNAAGVILAEYEYDEKGNRKALRYPQSGMETIYQYNDGNRVICLENRRQGTMISAWKYVYDVDGNILNKIGKDGSDPVTISYCYDRLGRLTEEDYSGWKRTFYTYDTYSNRVKMMVEGRTKDELISVTSYEYGLNNRQEKVTKKQGKTTETYRYRYDDNGNEIFRIWEKTAPTPDYPGNVKLSGHYQMETPAVYEWRHYDGFNQLIQINQDDKEITYQYRGDGFRHSAYERKLTEHQGKTNLYCWDGTNIVAEQTDGEKNKIYLRGFNLIASIIDSVVYYYILNEHGDVTHLWSQKGTCKTSYEYDAFGIERNRDKEDENPFRYCGEYFDLCSGTYYLRNRNYNPQNGRFMSQDRFDYMDDWDPLSLNLYTYCQNNPLRYYDPSGNSPKDILYGFITALDDSIFWGGAQKAAELFWGKFNKNNESDYDYYLGRVAGDIVAMASGEGASIWGILEMGGSIIGGGAVTIGSGGTLAIGGVVIVADGVAIGAATTAAGVGIMAMAARNFGSDWNDLEGASRGRKGETFRGGSKSQRDNWYGYDNKDFQNWWHRSGKVEFGGSDIDSAKEAKQIFDYWKSIGSPKVK